MTEQDALLVLNAISGLGNARIRRLMDCFGSAAKVLSLSEAALEAPAIIAKDVVQNILKFPKDNFLKSEYNLVALNGVRVICWMDEEYPPQLREIPDAPVVLYVKGHNIREASFKAVALVGSRSASFYGLQMAETFARELAQRGISVISGLARGVDTSAHKGALKGRGQTIAVLGSGLAEVYPPENKGLCEEIAQHGAAISEFPMTLPPLPHNFPRRNRIVSGLSSGVVVVEAADKSGALITADFALEQGREVFAVPGKVDNPGARGVNRLIQQGAKLVMNIEDVIEELRIDIGNAKPQESNVQPNEIQLSHTEESIYKHISHQSIHLNELSQKSGVSLATLTPILLQLELKKLIRQLPGKYFSK